MLNLNRRFAVPSFLLSILLVINIFQSRAQPAEIEWLPAIKTAKDQRTLALLSAGSGGFQLLRWQERRTDAAGNILPAVPLLTVLTPGGERLHDEPLPGFADGALTFRFAFSNDSVLLIVYEAPGDGGQTLYARRLHLNKRKWSAAPIAIFTDPAGKSPAFATAWFSRSADGSHWCCYRARRLPSGVWQLSVAVFDAGFRLDWQRDAELPAQSGPVAPRSVFCANNGAVLLHARVFGTGTVPPLVFSGEPPGAHRPDGRPPYRRYDMEAELPAYSDALFLLSKDDKELSAFYPKIGKKFTPSFELTESAGDQVYCAGFTSDENNTLAEGYFVYAIDLKTRKGEMLQNAPLPAAVRKLFMSEKAAAKKSPVEDLRLRGLYWAGDGKAWMLAERENFAQHPGQIKEAALFRLDSTFRITAARKIEKYQNLPAGDAQNFASVAVCAAPKGAWWLLWNQGSWPDTRLMLTECRASSNPEDFQLALSSRTNVAMLPQTLIRQGNKWYFVGESEYHERIRIGVLKPR